jgi:hypothetical protein
MSVTIIGKTAIFEPQPSLRFRQTCLFRREFDQPLFTSLDFATVYFLQSKDVKALRSTANLEDQVSVFMTPVTGWAD